MRFVYDSDPIGVVEIPDGITSGAHVAANGSDATTAAALPYLGTAISVVQVQGSSGGNVAVKLPASAPPGATMRLYGIFTIQVFPPDGIDLFGHAYPVVTHDR